MLLALKGKMINMFNGEIKKAMKRSMSALMRKTRRFNKLVTVASLVLVLVPSLHIIVVSVTSNVGRRLYLLKSSLKYVGIHGKNSKPCGDRSRNSHKLP